MRQAAPAVWLLPRLLALSESASAQACRLAPPRASSRPYRLATPSLARPAAQAPAESASLPRVPPLSCALSRFSPSRTLPPPKSASRQRHHLEPLPRIQDGLGSSSVRRCTGSPCRRCAGSPHLATLLILDGLVQVF
ncbi:hypothetical protein ZWY2020_031013 [Hordeum vulgare]|nr:hypothetical protein ZWY2020_031013 [Hordeum vulgare]